jgi:hypothetical protein
MPWLGEDLLSGKASLPLVADREHLDPIHPSDDAVESYESSAPR